MSSLSLGKDNLIEGGEFRYKKNYTRNSLNFRKQKKENRQYTGRTDLRTFHLNMNTLKYTSLAILLANSPITYSHNPAICFPYHSSNLTCIWVMWLMPMSFTVSQAIRGQELCQVLHTIVIAAARTTCGVLSDRKKYFWRNVSCVASLLLHLSRK